MCKNKLASVKPKKHLGQHFLKDQNIAKKIVNALEANSKEMVVEIGPGTGVLTQYLLPKYDHFLAFDVDHDSVVFLKEKYPAEASKFVCEDYLHHRVSQQELAIIGNFPYNISSQIFFKIYDDRSVVKEVVCMIQKEVADRICASHGNKTYGILSVLLKAFFTIDYLFEVPPSVFNPPPKVQSAVIRLTRNEIKQLDCDEVLFKQIVKAGFGQRRKTLRNALKALALPITKVEDEVLGKRAEQLSVNEFISLTSTLSA